MRGNKPGFGLIELVIAFAILAILAVAIVPRFQSRLPAYQQEKFVSDLNSLMQVAWHDTIVSGKLHRVLFDLEKRTVSLEVKKEQKDKFVEDQFEPIKSAFSKNSIKWPQDLEVKNFFIGDLDEMKSGVTEREKIWFFIVPSGLAQPVIVNVEEPLQLDVEEGKSEFGLVLNPFLVQFKKYETSQYPT